MNKKYIIFALTLGAYSTSLFSTKVPSTTSSSIMARRATTIFKIIQQSMPETSNHKTLAQIIHDIEMVHGKKSNVRDPQNTEIKSSLFKLIDKKKYSAKL
jgi:hypothetical protein